MECFICGQDRAKKRLFETDYNPESPGPICQSCINHLKERQWSDLTCGFFPADDACENKANYALGSQEHTREMGSVKPTGTKIEFGDTLLCEEHVQELQKRSQPPWE